jgi:hypothetical protein
MSSGTNVAAPPAARTASSSSEFFEAADRARHRDHMGAGTRQRDTRRVTDAARGAGDKRDAAGERLRHCSARFGEQR